MSLFLRSSVQLPGSGGPDAPSHRDLVLALSRYARTNTAKGVLLFASDYALFIGALAGVLFLPSLGLKIIASVIAGVKMANLATLGHDAAHNTLTSSRKLNRALGIASFMPCLFNYRLWIYDHHALHHPHTNGAHIDSYQPLSKAAYDALTPMQQRWHRFTRSGNPLAFGAYYIVQRWWQVKFMPRGFLPQALRAAAWQHTAFLVAYFAGFMALLLTAPSFAPVSAAAAVLLGFALPFFIFQGLLAFSLYINHTHPDIPWFNRTPALQDKLPSEAITLHLRFPHWFATLAHHFYDHPAHHAYPAIPCYELGKAQAHMNRMLGARALVLDFSLPALANIFRKCKLYDYQNHRWLDYAGRPTTPTARSILESQAQSRIHNLIQEN